ncbi:hypothetical protein BDF14DRAFT_317225 [Spinellus fusiger]|nr:hypothetical protein BDF14DRAFT_317225 [Spinellus fusiger]
MPFHLISSLVYALVRRTTPETDLIDKPPTSSFTFSPTNTLHGLWNKKPESHVPPLDYDPTFHPIEHWYNLPPLFKSGTHACADDYDLLETLGTGTFGRVYLAKEKKQHKFYAIKVLKKSEIVRLKQVEHINSELESTLFSVACPQQRNKPNERLLFCFSCFLFCFLFSSLGIALSKIQCISTWCRSM